VPRLAEGDPTDEILAAASLLFGELGVGGTTMARIATESGLGPSSLYYYFGRKEEVVVALVARANVIPLSLLERIGGEPAPPAVQLYRFVRGDVVALCGLPFDINEVHRIAARDRRAFAGYWRERAELETGLHRIVRAGVADGSFRPVDPRLAALTVMADDEAVQNWYRYTADPGRDAYGIGTFCADLVVAGLLERRSRLEAVRRRADRLDALAAD
jgi:TetR/AcrR family transcriptional regulator